MEEKTNVMRTLDRLKLAYHPYAFDTGGVAISGTEVAALLGKDPAQVFKTLVLKGDKTGHFVCVVPGDAEVDLKKAAKVSGNKKVDLIPMKELLPTTGYIRGGCSPVGMKKAFPTYFHSTCMDFDYIYVSAGVRGLQLKIAPADLVKYVRASVAEIIVEK